MAGSGTIWVRLGIGFQKRWDLGLIRVFDNGVLGRWVGSLRDGMGLGFGFQILAWNRIENGHKLRLWGGLRLRMGG